LGNRPTPPKFGGVPSGVPMGAAAKGVIARMEAKRVLVVEDDALISMAVETEVADAGHAVVGPFGSGREALAALRSGALPDAAVLDLRLRDGPCFALARALDEAGVPFLIYTGSTSLDGPRQEFGAVPWIEKPAPTGRLAAALDTLLRAHALAA